MARDHARARRHSQPADWPIRCLQSRGDRDAHSSRGRQSTEIAGALWLGFARMAARRTLACAASIAVAATALYAMSAQVLAAPSTWLELDGNIRTDAPPGAIHDWGNSGAATPINTCPAVPGVVNVSGSGGLFNCGSPGAGSAPPNPPTLTPAAAADPSIVSAVYIVDPISTDTTTCGAVDPTIFGGGLKNGDDINTWERPRQGRPQQHLCGKPNPTGRPPRAFLRRGAPGEQR